MTYIYSNKLTVNISTEQPQYPIKEIKLYVSTDGVNWGTSATGNTLYFKAECYDQNGNLADTILYTSEVLSEYEYISVSDTPKGMVVSSTADLDMWQAKVYVASSYYFGTSNSYISTKGGVAEWSITAPQILCSGIDLGISSNQVVGIPYPNASTPEEKNANINNPVFSNNVSISMPPLKVRTPYQFNITSTPKPTIVPMVSTVSSPSATPSYFTYYYFKPNTTYYFTLQVVDQNGNPCPFCQFSSGWIGEMDSLIRKFFNGDMITVDQNGTIEWKYTTGSSGNMPGFVPMFSSNPMINSINYFGNNYTPHEFNNYQFFNFVGQPNFPSSFGVSKINVDNNNSQYIIQFSYIPSAGYWLLSFDPATGQVTDQVRVPIYNSEAIVNFSSPDHPTVYLMIAPDPRPINYNSTPQIILSSYGGWQLCGSISASGNCNEPILPTS